MARQQVKNIEESTEECFSKTGVVQYVPEPKIRQTKEGPKKAYSFKLDDSWFNCGFANPEVKAGQTVSFSYTENQYGFQVVVESLKTETAPVTSAKKKGDKFPKKEKVEVLTKDDYWARKEVKDEDTQLLITFQASRNAAIAFVTAALQSECIPLPAKQAARLDNVLALVDEITERFYTTALSKSTQVPEASVTDKEEAEAEGDADGDD